MTRSQMTRTFRIAFLVHLCFTKQSFAHAAEQGFVLLLPTDIYITAGTLTVAASIILISVLSKSQTQRLNSPWGALGNQASSNSFISLLSTVVLFCILGVGVLGPRDPLANLLPLTIWIIWWIAFVAFLPVSGNLWRHFNPWSGLYKLIIGPSRPPLILPKKLGYWPAVFVLVAFNGFAVADIAPNDPYRLALFVGGYWGFTFIGMLVFGDRAWLNQVECFSVFFQLISRISPFHDGKFGFPGWALLYGTSPGYGLAAFCVVMLGSGSFDGLHETFWWLGKIGINPLEFPGRSAVIATSWAGLIATNLALGLIFAISVWIGLKLAQSTKVTIKEALPLFALSLVPITFGYHLAHYLTSFLVGVQYAIVAFSDPLANGSDFFGVSDWRVTTGFLNEPSSVKLIWISQASAVVLSHVLAVILAHGAAVRLFDSKREVLLSQLALSILMIAYTVFGLWLLASPRGV